jgi:hypothetical protein
VLSVTQEHGLAVVCGSAAHNGVAGSTLGGANFGIVTGFEFDCFELGPEVAVAQPIYPAPDEATVRDLLGQYRDYVADAPREVTSMAIGTSFR